MTKEAQADSGAGGDQDPRSALRRRDRGKDGVWISAFLEAAPHGFLAVVGEGGQPFLNSNLFVFDDARDCVYLHTHRTGRTPQNLAEERKVAFGVSAMGRLLPASEALEFSVEYAGVVVFGTGRTVDDPEEASHALRILLEKYAPHLRYGEDYRGVTPAELKRTAVFRVDIETWSGKQKEVPSDFPGAFDLPGLALPFRAPGA